MKKKGKRYFTSVDQSLHLLQAFPPVLENSGTSFRGLSLVPCPHHKARQQRPPWYSGRRPELADSSDTSAGEKKKAMSTFSLQSVGSKGEHLDLTWRLR